MRERLKVVRRDQGRSGAAVRRLLPLVSKASEKGVLRSKVCLPYVRTVSRTSMGERSVIESEGMEWSGCVASWAHGWDRGGRCV